jgi:hypothetical protein
MKLKKSTMLCIALFLIIITLLIEHAYGDVKIVSTETVGEYPLEAVKSTVRNDGTHKRTGTATLSFLGSGSEIGSINWFEQESYPFELDPGQTTTFTFNNFIPTARKGWKVETKDDVGQTSTWYTWDGGATWSNLTKKQSMTFESPFSLSNLTIPGSVTFELAQTDMINHALNFMLPEFFGGGTVSLNFTHGYGEIFFNNTARADMVLFNITEWIMTYTEFYLPGRGWTGLNEAITSPESYGALNVTSGEMSMYETGVYLDNFYSQQNPLRYFIFYTGTVDFISNIIHLEGEGAVYFPQIVGGIVVPIDGFALLVPYIGLASTIMVATVASSISVKRVKRRKEKQ